MQQQHHIFRSKILKLHYSEKKYKAHKEYMPIKL